MAIFNSYVSLPEGTMHPNISKYYRSWELLPEEHRLTTSQGSRVERLPGRASMRISNLASLMDLKFIEIRGNETPRWVMHGLCQFMLLIAPRSPQKNFHQGGRALRALHPLYGSWRSSQSLRLDPCHIPAISPKKTFWQEMLETQRWTFLKWIETRKNNSNVFEEFETQTFPFLPLIWRP
jgi:hypothetical protein